MSTITGTIITQTVTLASGPVTSFPTYASPLTITSTGAVEVTLGTAIFGPGTNAWTVANQGIVSTSTASNYVGVGLDLGGDVENSANGLIRGNRGVVIAGAAGTVTNSATIIGGAFFGVGLYDGGSVANTGTGLIEGYRGVDIFGAPGTVTNSGTIVATGPGGNAFGVFLDANGGPGGSVGNTGLIEGYKGVYIFENGRVTNSGTIIGTGRVGVSLAAGGTVVDSGTITGGKGIAVYFYGGGANRLVLDPGYYLGGKVVGLGATNTLELGSAASAGTVSAALTTEFVGFGAATVDAGANWTLGGSNTIGAGVTLTNLGTLTIAGSLVGAGTFVVDPATLFNSGSIGLTVTLSGGGYLDNEAGGTIAAAGTGVFVTLGAATIVNAGTITGAVGISINAADTGNNTISNYGTIIGTSGTAISLGTVGTELVVIGSTSASLQGIITNLKPGDRFDLPFMTFSNTGTTTVVSNGTVSQTLDVIENGGTFSIALDPNQNFSGDVFQLGTDSGTGTLITETPCFCRGTLIVTDRGEVPVEALAIGDRVITVSGAAKPIKWIGRRSYQERFIAGNRKVLPIRIEARALAEGVPARDLWVSPEHALYIDEVLVPAGLLVNGATIRQVESVERLEYFHIELDSHDVILAEGALAESFVDCDNRFMFQNSNEFAALYPGDKPAPWDFCAPRLDEASAELPAIRAALLARAEALGRMTSEPDLYLIADGAIIRAQSVADRVWRFVLPRRARALAIASRSAVPAEAQAASTDERRLGVAVERFVLGGARSRVEIGHDCTALCQGFHADEGAHRWTDGMARLPEELLRPLTSGVTVEVHLADTKLCYPADLPAGAAKATASKRTRASMEPLGFAA